MPSSPLSAPSRSKGPWWRPLNGSGRVDAAPPNETSEHAATDAAQSDTDVEYHTFAAGFTPSGQFARTVNMKRAVHKDASLLTFLRFGSRAGFKTKSPKVAQLVGRLRRDEQELSMLGDRFDLRIREERSDFGKLDEALAGANGAVLGARRYVQEMTGDFELQKHKATWLAAIRRFADVAFGCVPDRAPTALALVSELIDCIEAGEPSLAPHATAVVLFHPTERKLLKVFGATDASEAQAGDVYRRSSHKTLAIDAWTVIDTPLHPVLRNAHGLAEARGKHSVVPLLEAGTHGRCFGVIISGGTECMPVPDEFLLLMAKAAGPLYERVHKMQQINAVITMATSWMQKVSMSEHQLLHVHWAPGRGITTKPTEWEWQPLLYHKPGDDLKSFELELRWTTGETLGLLTIECGKFTEADEHVIELMHVTAPLIQQCVEDIAATHVGDPAPISSVPELQAAFAQARLLLPVKLQHEMRRQLAALDAQIFAEIHTYDKVDAETHRLFQGVLVLLGHAREETKTWVQTRKIITSNIRNEMLELDLGDEFETGNVNASVLKRRWAESVRATHGIDMKALTLRSTAATKAIIKWLLATRMLHQIIVTLHDETDECVHEHLSGTGKGELRVGTIHRKPTRRGAGEGKNSKPLKHTAHKKHGAKGGAKAKEEPHVDANSDARLAFLEQERAEKEAMRAEACRHHDEGKADDELSFDDLMRQAEEGKH